MYECLVFVGEANAHAISRDGAARGFHMSTRHKSSGMFHNPVGAMGTRAGLVVPTAVQGSLHPSLVLPAPLEVTSSVRRWFALGRVWTTAGAAIERSLGS